MIQVWSLSHILVYKITESSEIKDTPYFRTDQPFVGKNLLYVNQQMNFKLKKTLNFKFKLDGWLE